MKKIFYLLVLVASNHLFAQISNEDAIKMYQTAESQYEKSNFYKCAQTCEDLSKKMGSTNPRILYLYIKAVYNNLSNVNDISKYKLFKTYKNYQKFDNYSSQFFSMIDKNTYPIDKFNEIVQIDDYFKSQLTKLEKQKDLQPQEAVNFLNTAASKFAKKNLIYENIMAEYKMSRDIYLNFSLTDSILKIKEKIAEYDKIQSFWVNFSNALGNDIYINLKKVHLINKQIKEYKFYLSSSNDEEEKLHNSTFLECISYKFNSNYYLQEVKYSKHPLEVFDIVDKRINKLKDKDKKFFCDFDIYYFFDMSNKDFIENNYEERIRNAFEFLLEYYGSSDPRDDTPDEKVIDPKENKTTPKKEETNSKF